MQTSLATNEEFKTNFFMERCVSHGGRIRVMT